MIEIVVRNRVINWFHFQTGPQRLDVLPVGHVIVLRRHKNNVFAGDVTQAVSKRSEVVIMFYVAFESVIKAPELARSNQLKNVQLRIELQLGNADNT